MKITKFVAILMLGLYSNAYANLETDKSAGICAAYMSLRGKKEGANVALRMADNPSRAMEFAKQWVRTSPNPTAAMAFEGHSACKAIGLMPADYTK